LHQLELLLQKQLVPQMKQMITLIPRLLSARFQEKIPFLPTIVMKQVKVLLQLMVAQVQMQVVLHFFPQTL
jgi:hypothetical protein